MVCAIVHTVPNAAVADALRAFEVDTVIPTRGEPAPALAGALPEALATGADWIWVLDGYAVPQPGALDALLAATEPPADLPAPALLSSRVSLPDGSLHPDVLPWPEIFEKEITTAAVGHRLVSLRAARPGSLLVRADAVRDHALPRADFVSHGEVLEWTARLLRDERGYLVPTSVAVRSDREAPNPRRALRNRARMLRGDTWGTEEKLWFGFLLAQDAVRAAAGRT